MEIINLTCALAISQGITSVEYGMGALSLKNLKVFLDSKI